METNPEKPQNMIDTTDALEAVSVCQSMKNFLFLLILTGLILCQIIFWMNHFGLIDHEGSTPCPAGIKAGCPTAPSCCPGSKPQANRCNQPQDADTLVFLAATTEQPEQSDKSETTQQAEAVVDETNSVSNIQETIDKIVDSANQKETDESVLLEKESDNIPAEIPAEHATEQMLDPQTPEKVTEAKTFEEDVLKDKKALFHISGGFAKTLVTICNYVIIIAAILYSLSLLICLKISLVGRLGGINHIGRAFFVSLFLLVILIPWQTLLPGVLIGAIWRPGALWCECWARADCSLYWKILLYLRFCGLTLLAIWLLLLAQTRSSRWAHATLRRLGVVR